MVEYRRQGVPTTPSRKTVARCRSSLGAQLHADVRIPPNTTQVADPNEKDKQLADIWSDIWKVPISETPKSDASKQGEENGVWNSANLFMTPNGSSGPSTRGACHTLSNSKSQTFVDTSDPRKTHSGRKPIFRLLIESHQFDLFVSSMIMIYSVVLGAQYEWYGNLAAVKLGLAENDEKWKHAGNTFDLLEHIFNAV